MLDRELSGQKLRRVTVPLFVSKKQNVRVLITDLSGNFARKDLIALLLFHQWVPLEEFWLYGILLFLVGHKLCMDSGKCLWAM
jgi:hypothetical protein